MPLLQFDTDAPCPCGSGSAGRDCCLRQFRVTERDSEGTVLSDRVGWALEIPQADTRPPRPRTGLANTRCYAASLSDCSAKISAEHYLSAVILRRLAGPSGWLDVTGVPKDAPKKRLTASTLVARKLCERHNGALSPLDTVAGRVFDAIASVGNELGQGRDLLVGVNGHDFERWLLKYLCGLLTVRRVPIPEVWIRILFGECSILLPRGLYVYARAGDLMRGQTVRIEVAYEEDPMVPIGCRVQLLNADFVLAMTDRPPAALDHVGKLRIPRPGGFEFMHEATGARFVLAFSWQGDASHAPVRGVWSSEP
jgi:hypothetical protein